MLVLQQIDVLPAGAAFKIMDENREILTGSKSLSDDSIIFDNVHDSQLYYKVCSVFHMIRLDIEVKRHDDDLGNDVVYVLKVR